MASRSASQALGNGALRVPTDKWGSTFLSLGPRVIKRVELVAAVLGVSEDGSGWNWLRIVSSGGLWC
jgi:hypothetical protein